MTIQGSPSISADTITATTAEGPVRGRRHDGYRTFFAVPYAAAPVGDLRFAPPRPAVARAAELDATTMGAICEQDLDPLPFNIPPTQHNFFHPDAVPSEDSLTLNIWTPDVEGTAPVLFWIHGGAFLYGSGTGSWTDGARHAREHGVVVVSINYRLGILGGLYLGDKRDGWVNVALQDQIQALRWVHENIAAFGGDPANVTIAGQSAGAMSAAGILVSPAAEGLFRRAIVQSGHLGVTTSIDDAIAHRNTVLRQFGIDPGADDAIEQLQRVNILRVLAVQRSHGVTLGTFPLVRDGQVIAADPLELLRSGARRDIDLLIGTDAEEDRLLRHVLPNIWGPILVNTAMLAAINLGVQAGLNYLNLGVKPPAPSWGGLVAEAQINLQLQPWLVIPSGLTIALTIVAFILLADGLRDATSRSFVVSRPVSLRPSASADDVEPAPGVLEVRHLNVHFGPLRVVEDVSFSLQAGEILGIVGESGCGKSVTVSAVLDSLGPAGRTTGSIRFDGTDLLTAPARVRAATRGSGIAYVSQDPMVALDPSFTIGAQLGEIVRTHNKGSRAAARARVLELLTDVGLPDPPALVKKYPHQISGGQAQRVSIACALAGRPRVLVADEPTTALDVTVQGEILSLLRRLRDEAGMAIILITHDLGVIADLCDRVAVMYAGQIVETAPVRTLFEHPSHPNTAALIQANPIVAERGGLLPSIPGVVPAPADWPVGCHFYERCAFSTPSCAADPIPLVPSGVAQAARCIHLDAVLGAKS
ncbi:oligopeptide/dipeptide ABC transporter ATP-binding protein [Actinoplanes tereljensis]|uniref:ABC transporter domain-containing protein n=1 Tax=Paractinoplanes tereljensis TaxID=571912 RepID=A0A919NSG6_9ACTN|nr:oligopeptide/dipeptide ABC transporter ATP-binding protein [Actinoplanes tereljensis]GIF23888.1 hypothetical protein Ate02nite_66180 [Actinoplanes tereljensis]